jgi:MFS family permease
MRKNSFTELLSSISVVLQLALRMTESSWFAPTTRHKALLAATLGYALDGFDMLILGFLLDPIAEDFGVTRVQASALTSWTLFGALIGGVVFGVLSDRFGRVRTLSWSILVFAGFTGLCALAKNYEQLIVFRTLAGVGLGGEFGLGMALVAESWPATQRARACSYVGVGWQAGVLLAAGLVPLLAPVIGWRGVFVVGVFPSLLAFVVRRHVGESEIFLKQRQPTGFLAPLRSLCADAETIKKSFGMIVLCAVQNFGYYGLMIWLPTHLSSRYGFSLTKSGLWTAVTVCGMTVGALAFGAICDRYGRRPAFLGFQFGAVLMVLIYARLTDPLAVLIGGAGVGVFVNGMIGGYGALLSELYPTSARATAENVLFNIGRALGGLGPVVIGALAGGFSFDVALSFLASLYLIDMIVTLWIIPETRGQRLL